MGFTGEQPNYFIQNAVTTKFVLQTCSKFRFFDEALVGGKWPLSESTGLPGLEQQQEEGNIEKLYGSEEELLEYALKKTNARHYQQLRFLAERHQGTILKLRFVLSPFAFVFLLEGREQFHIVLETLDTKEATYVWHLGKNRQGLPDYLTAIDEDLATIKNKGRQAFLANQPKNFSRIIHNYSDERKGFILWRELPFILIDFSGLCHCAIPHLGFFFIHDPGEA